jgi:hypothetical protein
VSKIIAPLAQNGAATKTHRLVAGSPALNAVPAGNPGCIATPTDQRGLSRPASGGCDIGAFEKQ